jgi:sec-independent protein translocase protein TatC
MPDEDIEELKELSEVEVSKMPLTQHLDELRKRLVYSIVIVFVLGIVAYIFKEPLLGFLQRPYLDALGLELTLDRLDALGEKIKTLMEGIQCEEGACFAEDEVETLGEAVGLLLKFLSGLIYTAPAEAFLTYIKLSLFSGIIVGMPVLLAQVWKFVVPALYKNERRYFLSFLTFGSGLFYLGVAFCFTIVLPLAMLFLVGIGQGTLVPLFSVGNYISFAMMIMLVFGLSFEMPLAMFIIVKMGLVKRQTLIDQWRYVVAGAFVLGAILTPPDPPTQIAMAGAIIVLYGVGLVLTKYIKPDENVQDEEDFEF